MQFQPTSHTCNPHLHLIVPSCGATVALVEEWFNFWTPKHVSRAGQHYRKVTNKEADLIEVIKYETKVFTEPDCKKKSTRKGSAKIYIRALDNIHAAMKGMRLIDRFGFNAPKKAKDKTECILTDNYMEWHYDLKSRDWLNEEHESTPAAYTPQAALESLLERI